jgi:hypothetical protein
MKPLTRRQIREALDTVPIDSVLGVSGELTGKQREFCKQVASGQTKAESYRKAYKRDATKNTMSSKPYVLMQDERIKREVEAYRLANEASKHRTAGQLRDLVIHSLVQVIIDPEAKQATKVQASRVLGTVAGVDAFIHRSETKVIKSSESTRDQIMHELRKLMANNATDATEIDPDALLIELAGPGAAPTTPDSADGTWDDIHSVSLTKPPPPIKSNTSKEEPISTETPPIEN